MLCSRWSPVRISCVPQLQHRQILARVDVLNSMSATEAAASNPCADLICELLCSSSLPSLTICRGCSPSSSSDTQAMLVAGAAVASLGGESLETIDDERTMWQSALGAAFVGTSATTMAASLWVIVVSSTLITLSQQSVLQGHSSDEVSRVDAILSRKVADVRLFYTASIFMLLVSSLLMVWINQTLLNGLITTLIFGGFVQLAYVTIRGTYDEFGQQTSLQLSEEERQSPLSRLVSLLGSLKHVHAYAPLGNPQPTHHPSHHPSDPRAPPPPPPPPPPLLLLRVRCRVGRRWRAQGSRHRFGSHRPRCRRLRSPRRPGLAPSPAAPPPRAGGRRVRRIWALRQAAAAPHLSPSAPSSGRP